RQRHVSCHWTTPQGCAAYHHANPLLDHSQAQMKRPPPYEAGRPASVPLPQCSGSPGSRGGVGIKPILGRAAAGQTDPHRLVTKKLLVNARKVGGKREDSGLEVVLDSGLDFRCSRSIAVPLGAERRQHLLYQAAELPYS